ncbi:MAG: MBL fold metallo-hydrolase [Chloroflexi bacterium]|nr:MBL fold metallo-hydrolase [Chloroflexota bacterium]
MRITLLGTGTSHGVPTIDCTITENATCPRGVCRRALSDPRHRRTRSSALVEANGCSLLLDTSQDFYQQMLANHVRRIDAVLYTHLHADHVFGLPDIRSYSHRQGQPVDVYGSGETLESLQRTFAYAFRQPPYRGAGIPALTPHRLEWATEIGGVPVTPLPVRHSGLQGCQGYRLGDVAYIPDAHVIPDETLARMQGLELLIINCLRLHPHPAHLCLEESLGYAQAVQPRRCLFTHMTHDIDYEEDIALLPAWAAFAYDGQMVELA